MAYENILSALADPTRRAIFEDLRHGPLPVQTLADCRSVSRPAVSQHLKVLELSGLVTAERRGTARYYSVRPKGLAPLRSYLDDMWGDVLQAFSEEVTRQNKEADHAATRGKDD